MRVLSIDFDFWVPQKAENDFGMLETAFHIHHLWNIRHVQFAANGKNIEEIITIKEEPKPIDLPFLFAKKLINYKKFAVAESHQSLVHWIYRNIKLDIIHIDAHHDFGYDTEKDGCDNWVRQLVKLGQVRKIHLVYPLWRQELLEEDYSEKTARIIEDWRSKGIEVIQTFGLETLPKHFQADKLFLCRSGAWVPPWLDDEFIQLAKLLARQNDHLVYTHKTIDDFKRLGFDRAEFAKQAEQLKQFVEKNIVEKKC